MGRAWLALLLCAWAARLFSVDAEDANSRPASSAEVSQIQEYTRALSKEWLKDYVDIDVDAIGMRMRHLLWRRMSPPGQGGQALTERGPGGESRVAGPGAELFAMDLQLEQYDDLRRLQADLRDIPFAIRFDADSAFFGEKVRLKTSLFLPLSWKDELRAEARMPLPSLAPKWVESMLNLGGFEKGWDLKSSYGNRLGVSSVQTGLGTQWLNLWTLNYEFRVRFGQDNYEESQWIRLGRDF